MLFLAGALDAGRAGAPGPSDGRDAEVDGSALARLQESLPGPSWRAFVGTFVEQGAVHVRRMETGLAARDFAAVGLAAHALRPTSSLLGAAGLSAACGELEAATRDPQGHPREPSPGADVGGMVRRVRRLFDAVAAVLRREASA